MSLYSITLSRKNFTFLLACSNWSSPSSPSFLPSFLSSFQSFSSELNLNQVVAGGSGWHLSAGPHLLSLERGKYITLHGASLHTTPSSTAVLQCLSSATVHSIVSTSSEPRNRRQPEDFTRASLCASKDVKTAVKALHIESSESRRFSSPAIS